MKVIKRAALETNWNEIKGMIQAGAFTPGDEIEINGCLWRVLDVEDNGVFIWKHTGIDERCAFNESGSNVYEGSDLQRYLQGEYMETIPDEMKELMSEEGLYPLSIEEIRKYLPTEGEHIAVDSDGDTVWYWTRSAYRGYGYYAWSVTSTGGAYNYSATNAIRCAPACKLLIS